MTVAVQSWVVCSGFLPFYRIMEMRLVDKMGLPRCVIELRLRELLLFQCFHATLYFKGIFVQDAGTLNVVVGVEFDQ